MTDDGTDFRALGARLSNWGRWDSGDDRDERGTTNLLTPERIVAALVDAGVGVRGFELRPPRLEDLFVSLTGEGFDVSR